MNEQNQGIAYATLAYFLWGMSAIFWKQISQISAVETTFHRIVWSFLFLAGILLLRRHWSWLKLLRNNAILLRLFLAAVLLALNWGLYIWAVNQELIVEASLGYFINPLVSVVFGVLFFSRNAAPLAMAGNRSGTLRSPLPDICLWPFSLAWAHSCFFFCHLWPVEEEESPRFDYRLIRRNYLDVSGCLCGSALFCFAGEWCLWDAWT